MAMSAWIRISRLPPFLATATNLKATNSSPSALRLPRESARLCRAISRFLRSSPIRTFPPRLSKAVLTGLLRGEMQFNGLIITDAMDMGGVTSHVPAGRSRRSLCAGWRGCAPDAPVPDAAMAGLLRGGKIRPHVRKAHRRLRTPDSRGQGAARSDKNRALQMSSKSTKNSRRPEYAEEAQKIADRGVTLLRDTPKTSAARFH